MLNQEVFGIRNILICRLMDELAELLECAAGNNTYEKHVNEIEHVISRS